MRAISLSTLLVSTSLVNHFKHQELLDYYEKAGPDYETWSPNFNMHFGYYERGINPFAREKLLQNMNKVVLENLKINVSKSAILVDMGCGLGATLRFAAKTYPLLKGRGVTLVPWQKREGTRLNTATGCSDRMHISVEDYTKTSIRSDTVDHVIAIESSCYATGADKRDLLLEIYRILKPGGTFVIADGFLKSKVPLKGVLNLAYQSLCKCWALEELGNIIAVSEQLLQIGFKEVSTTDISWKVAPSVAHVPFTVLGFLSKQLLAKELMSKERWNNLKSPLLTMFLGVHQKRFGYYLVKGIKPVVS